MNNILSEMWRSTQRRIRELEAENEKLRTWSQEKVDKVAMDGRIKFLEMRIRELEDERDAANARCAAMEAKLAVAASPRSGASSLKCGKLPQRKTNNDSTSPLV